MLARALSGDGNQPCGRGGGKLSTYLRAGTARGEVAEGAAAACRSEVAGGACWHALCQAKETTLVVAGAATCRGEVAGAATCRGEVAGAATCRGEVAGGA